MSLCVVLCVAVITGTAVRHYEERKHVGANDKFLHATIICFFVGEFVTLRVGDHFLSEWSDV